MGRHKIPLKQKMRNAIVAYGDQFIKQDGDTVTCIKCPKAIPFLEQNIGSRIKAHVSSNEHKIAIISD